MQILHSHVCKVVWNLLLWGYAVNYIAILTHSNHSMLGSKSSCDCKMPLLCVRPDHQTVGLAKRSKARLKRFPGLSSSTFIFDVSAFLMQQHFRASLLPQFVQNGKLLKLPHRFLFLLDRWAFPVRGEGLAKVLFGSNCLKQTWEGKAWKSPSCPCQQMQTGAAAKSFWIKSRAGTLFPSEKNVSPSDSWLQMLAWTSFRVFSTFPTTRQSNLYSDSKPLFSRSKDVYGWLSVIAGWEGQ